MRVSVHMKWVSLPAIVAIVCGVARAADGAPRPEILFRGMREARDRLQSGVFRAVGRVSVTEESKQRVNGEVKLFCAFDFFKDMFRFDRNEPALVAVRNASEEERIDVKYVRTSTQSLHWESVTPDVRILPPNAPPPFLARAFDVRVLGLGNERDMTQGYSFEQFYRVYTTQSIHEFTESTKGVYHLSWLFGDSGRTQKTLWISEKHGNSPIRFDVREKGPGDKWLAPSTICEMTWFKQSNVWVPETVIFETVRGLSRHETYTLAFEWESVNQPVSEELFTLAGLEIAPNWNVVDERLGRPIVLGTVEQQTSGHLRQQGGRRSFGFVWLLGGVAIGIALLLFVYYRAGRKRSLS